MNITIGIPAYNEALNIKRLLGCLVDQQTHPFVLHKIYVLSDGSTDDTVKLARSVDDPRIQVIAGRKNLGLATRQNQLFDLIDTPIAVLLDADTLPQNNKFLTQLCLPVLKNKQVGLTSAQIITTPSSTYIGRTLAWHHQWKNNLYQSINHGDNIYLCHGRARAFSRSLYQQLRWPQGYGEDAYSYIYSKQQGFQFRYVSQAKIYCSIPDSLSDHLSQSSRFLKSIQKNQAHSEINNWYHIPPFTFIKHMVSGCLTHPIYALGYIVLILTSILLSRIQSHTPQSHLWRSATSTKSINI